MYNLTKKAINGDKLMLSTDGEWVTTGHWLSRIDMFKQASLLTSISAISAMFPRSDVTEISDELIARVIPKFAEPMEYHRTKWLQVDSCHGDVVLFVGSDEVSQLWLQQRYVDLFDLEVLTGEAAPESSHIGPAAIGADDPSVVIMTMDIPYQAGLT